MAIRHAVFAVGVQLVSGETYCPTLDDFDIAWGSVTAEGNGWRVDGEGGVHGKTSWNLLGGSIEFDMDVCGAQTGVNNNFYTISPQGGPSSGYCDIQTNDSPICMELDIIENNGKCLGRTTWHVWGNKDGGCDQNGCYGEYHFDDGCQFHMRTEFGEDGSLIQYKNGQVINIKGPSDIEKNQIKQNMESTGAAIASTQWKGWVPDDGSCGGLGDSNGFQFAVTNVVVNAPQGIKFGSSPPTCAGPSPPPPGPSSWYKTITPSSNTNLCLDLPGDDASNGNLLWLWDCNGQESQRWVFDNGQIRFGADESKCIDAGGMSNAEQLFLWDCNGYPQQTWGYDSDASRVYLTDTSICLDFYADWQSSGQPLHVWDCTGDSNQEWSLWNVDPSPSPSPAPSPSPSCDCGLAASGCGDDDGSFCFHYCCWGAKGEVSV